ncbi:MAG: hypothetical protein EZS28_006637 [Streblomastix strix]|uniref:Uncharacterized protein n=1 Tax=Streblomastix strix TaxID=222440 RepID=A0A5J4WSF2_9EUKA|nr:MAG: hypothetical protein EZS28_006637 [Streblomastix strix]
MPIRHKEEQIWDLDVLLDYIKSQVPYQNKNLPTIQYRRAIAATLVMLLTVARLAELHRAILLSTSDDEYIIQTTILKSLHRIVELKFCKIPDERICPLIWFKSCVQVDGFTHHSDIASIVKQYYDKNNNVEAREVIGQMEEEFDNKEDVEQERTLLEEIEHERSTVEYRIPCLVVVLSLGLSHLETPTELEDVQKAQQKVTNVEEIAILLGSNNIG